MTSNNDKQLTLRIEGMHCASCVANVQRALASVPTVAEAHVNLATETATVLLTNPDPPVESLVKAVRQAGYRATPLHDQAPPEPSRLRDEHAEQLRQYRRAIVWAVALGVPIMAIDIFGRLGYGFGHGRHTDWLILQAILCAGLFASPAGASILVGGFRSAAHRAPNMDLLVAIGISAAFLGFHYHASAMILIFINVGRFLEAKARRQAGSALATLIRSAPASAVRLRGPDRETVPVPEVQVGDRLLVAEENLVPVDGTIVTGQAAIDESMLTGESVPVDRAEGDSVRAGTLVKSGLITIEATATGGQSAIARIIRLVEQAQGSPTRMQRLADRVAGVFVPVVVILAILTAVAWWSSGVDDAWTRGLQAAIAILVISCPCAMGLATPTAVLVATGVAALRGILVRDAAALEAAGQVDTIIFDKTGTVTTGRMRVEKILDEPVGHDTQTDRDILYLAASAEQYSQHPLARSIVAKASQYGLTLVEPADYEALPGLGVRCTVDGRPILVGSPHFVQERGVDLTPIQPLLTDVAMDGQTPVVLAVESRPAGVIGLADTVRPNTSRAVDRLTRLNLQLLMVTGDQSTAAAAVAGSVGIRRVVAEVDPEGKIAMVRKLQDRGARVAMVGDGVNDAPALAAADVGIAFATGTDVAAEAADVTLVRPDLRLIADAVVLARRSVTVIKQNLFWAFFYNILAIPLAALGHVPPFLAAAAMMASSLTVVLNALRLRNALPPPAPDQDA